ncbi:MAG: right-handed parallel beta-helix repeat-containing protein [Clostridia bacterium]|nr:right-handed parallel beta-helix repeat-containing protein [Clostridia bacterium]
MTRSFRILICLLLAVILVSSAAVSVFGDVTDADMVRKARFYSRLFRERYESGTEGGTEAEAEETGDTVSSVVFVSADGSDENGDGTESSPFATVTHAMEKLRETNGAGSGGATVVLGNGTFSLSEPIVITSDDSGPDRPLTIKGSGDTLICGGVYLDSSAFAKAEGDVVSLFPESVRDSIVMLDLKQYGYSPEDIAGAKTKRNYLKEAVMLSENGTLQTLCRYPNDDWSFIPEGWMLDQYGNVTDKTDNDGDPEHEAKKYVIRYDSELESHVRTWSMYDRVYVAARLNQLWCTDNTYVLEFDPEDTVMTLPYTGGYNPVPGGVFYWYNVPEELDMPGEYYVSDDAVLYYCPSADFENSSFTIPVSRGLVDITADCVTLKDLRFDASAEDGITASGDDIAVTGCEITSIHGEYAVRVTGDRAKITGNVIHDVCQTAVSVESGNIETLEKGDSLVSNNRIYNFGINDWPYTMGVDVDGAGVTVSHNEIYDSKTRGIYWDGAYMTIEYNDVHDVLTSSDDIGAISCDGRVHAGNVIRYNFIHNIGCTGVLKDINKLFPDYRYIGCAAVYGDFYGSYYECYGNVILTVNGSGFYGGGRGIGIHNNLIMDCSRWYVSLSSYDYEDFYSQGTGGTTGFASYIHNEAWTAANPDLAGLVTDLSKVDRTDPSGYAMPVGIEVRNNWIHFNKFVRDFSNWGIAPYSLSESMFFFSGDTIDVENRTNANVSVYNSKRDSLDIEEVIRMSEELTGIDYETFLSMGLEK